MATTAGASATIAARSTLPARDTSAAPRVTRETARFSGTACLAGYRNGPASTGSRNSAPPSPIKPTEQPDRDGHEEGEARPAILGESASCHADTVAALFRQVGCLGYGGITPAPVPDLRSRCPPAGQLVRADRGFANRFANRRTGTACHEIAGGRLCWLPVVHETSHDGTRQDRPIGGGLAYTEEVTGSSPVPPTTIDARNRPRHDPARDGSSSAQPRAASRART